MVIRLPHYLMCGLLNGILWSGIQEWCVSTLHRKLSFAVLGVLVFQRKVLLCICSHIRKRQEKKIYLRLQYSGRTPFQDDETITRSQEKASSIADALVLLGKMAPFVICNVSINWTTVKSLPWNGCYTASNLLFKRLSLHLLTLSPCNWKTFILTEKMCQYPCEPCHKPVQSAIWRIHAQVRQQPPVAFYLELCNWTTHNILSSICLAH